MQRVKLVTYAYIQVESFEMVILLVCIYASPKHLVKYILVTLLLSILRIGRVCQVHFSFLSYKDHAVLSDAYIFYSFLEFCIPVLHYF